MVERRTEGLASAVNRLIVSNVQRRSSISTGLCLVAGSGLSQIGRATTAIEGEPNIAESQKCRSTPSAALSRTHQGSVPEDCGGICDPKYDAEVWTKASNCDPSLGELQVRNVDRYH